MPRDVALSTPEERVKQKKDDPLSVVICTPTITQPFKVYLDSLRASIPAMDAAGIKHQATFEVGSAYISYARANMLHRALQTDAGAFVFIDHDMSWPPESLVRLIQTPGDVVCGTYRYKQKKVEYMGVMCGEGKLELRPDGCIRARWAPAGFLKVSRHAVRAFMRHHPELCFGLAEKPHVDLFNHGARNFCWYGEDYSFTDRWNEMGGDVWIQPDMQLDHNDSSTTYPGHFKNYLLENHG